MTHACYLLRSLNPRFRKGCYIGCTTDPRRRLRQHNGELGQGAGLTKAKRPWEMVLCVYGFPSHVEALKFEWAWQHPLESIAVREAAAKLASCKGIPAMITLACTMVTLPRWSSLNLTLQFMLSTLLQYRHGSPPLPPQMRLFVAPMSALPGKDCKDENAESDNVNSFPDSLSRKDLDDDYGGLSLDSCATRGIGRPTAEGRANSEVCAGDFETSSPLPPKLGKKIRKGKTPKGRDRKRGGGGGAAAYQVPEKGFVIDLPELESGVRLTFEGDEIADWDKLTVHCKSPARANHETTEKNQEREDYSRMEFDLTQLSLERPVSLCSLRDNGLDSRCRDEEDRLGSLSVKFSACTSICKHDGNVDDFTGSGEVLAKNLSSVTDESNHTGDELFEAERIQVGCAENSTRVQRSFAGRRHDEGIIDLSFDSDDEASSDSVAESVSSHGAAADHQSERPAATDFGSVYLRTELGSHKLHSVTGGDYGQQHLDAQEKVVVNDFTVDTSLLNTFKEKPLRNASEAKSLRNASEAKSLRNASEAKSLRNASEAKSLRNASEAKSLKNASEAKSLRNASEAKSLKNASEAKSLRNASEARSLLNTSKEKSGDRISTDRTDRSTKRNDMDSDDMISSKESAGRLSSLPPDSVLMKEKLRPQDSAVAYCDVTPLQSLDGPARKVENAVVLDLSPSPACERKILHGDVGKVLNELDARLGSRTTGSHSDLRSLQRDDDGRSNHQSANSDDSDIEEITVAQFHPVERRRMRAPSSRPQNFEEPAICTTPSTHDEDLSNENTACRDTSGMLGQRARTETFPGPEQATCTANSLPGKVSPPDARGVLGDHADNSTRSTELWTEVEGVGFEHKGLPTMNSAECVSRSVLDDDDEIQEISVNEFERSRLWAGARGT